MRGGGCWGLSAHRAKTLKPRRAFSHLASRCCPRPKVSPHLKKPRDDRRIESLHQMSCADTPTETKQTLTEEPKAAAEGAKTETDANSKLRRRRPGVSATIAASPFHLRPELLVPAARLQFQAPRQPDAARLLRLPARAGRRSYHRGGSRNGDRRAGRCDGRLCPGDGH